MGTKDEPYTSKLILTLSSSDSFEELPIFGRNVIGILNGTFNAHGSTRSLPWLELKYSVEPGVDTIILQHDLTNSEQQL